MKMRLIVKIFVLLNVTFLMCSTLAASQSPLCGEWTGSRPPKGTTLPNEQKWILTFREDKSFSFVVVDGGTPTAGLDGSYKAAESNVVIQLPQYPAVPMIYSIKEKTLRLNFSDLTTMLGGGKGIDTYVRTKQASELKPQIKQKLMREGRYLLSVSIAKDNDPTVLTKTFGEQYASRIKKPIDGGTWPIRNLQGRNIIQLSGERFGPAEFNGASFKVFGAVAPKVNGEFNGTISSSTEIKGSFKSRATTLHGTFRLKRVSGLR